MVGILGGLISSTAVTYNFSKLSKELNTVTLFLGIVLSWSVMNLRVVFLATFIDVNLFSHLIVPFLTLTGLYLVVAYLYYKKTDLSESIEYPGVSRPFSILSILQFGALYTFIFFMGKVFSFYLGNQGLYTLSLISGVIDIDAIVISTSNLTKIGSITQKVAVMSILIAVFSNSVFKYLYVYLFGAGWLKQRMAYILIFTLGYLLFVLLIFLIL